MKPLIYSFFAAVILFFSCGCSILAPSSEMISVQVIPKDSTIIINGTRFEGAPFYTPVSKSTDVLISVYKVKYPTRNYVIRRHLSIPGILDTIGSIAILPSIGLFFAGAWELEQNNVIINLNEDQTNVEEIFNKNQVDL